MFQRIKMWFKRTGIRNCNNEEVIDSLNPLIKIVETNAYPWARIHRSSFWEGMKDTFEVMIGNHYDACNHRGPGFPFKGILDILIFPTISRRLIFPLLNKNLPEEEKKFIGVMRLIIGGILEIPRLALGAALTIALSPFVGLVHAWSHFKTKKFKTTLDNFKTTHYLPEEKDSNKKEKTLKEIFKFDYEFATTSKINIQYKSISKTLNFKSHFVECAIKVNEQNADIIDALLQTNTFYITKRLEETNKLQEVRSLIGAKKSRKVIISGLSQSNANKSPLKLLGPNEPYLLKEIISFADMNPSPPQFKN